MNLEFDEVQYEHRRLDDDSYLVSMYCPMPNITSEMIEWWFWWHPKKNERYQVWFPGSHFSIGFSQKQADYFECFKQTDDGLFMIIRFWLGKTMKNPLIKKLIITDKMAKGMAEHCCIEYRNLFEILPILYCEQ